MLKQLPMPFHKLEMYLDSDKQAAHIHILEEESFSNILLDEITTLCKWLPMHPEIVICLFQKKKQKAPLGIDLESFHSDNKKLKEYIQKFRVLLFQLLNLPQITLCDLGLQSSNLFIEFTACCDLGVAHESSHLKFDYLSLGMTPNLPLSHSTFPSQAYYYFLKEELTPQDLKKINMISQIYNDSTKEEILNDLFDKVAGLSHLNFLELKKLFLTENSERFKEFLLHPLDESNLYFNDWKQEKDEQVPYKKNFKSFKEFKQNIS